MSVYHKFVAKIIKKKRRRVCGHPPQSKKSKFTPFGKLSSLRIIADQAAVCSQSCRYLWGGVEGLLDLIDSLCKIW